MQRRFRIVSYPKDIKLSVESRSFETLFKTSLLGMDEILKKGFSERIDGTLIRKNRRDFNKQ